MKHACHASDDKLPADFEGTRRVSYVGDAKLARMGIEQAFSQRYAAIGGVPHRPQYIAYRRSAQSGPSLATLAVPLGAPPAARVLEWLGGRPQRAAATGPSTSATTS